MDRAIPFVAHKDPLTLPKSLDLIYRDICEVLVSVKVAIHLLLEKKHQLRLPDDFIVGLGNALREGDGKQSQRSAYGDDTHMRIHHGISSCSIWNDRIIHILRQETLHLVLEHSTKTPILRMLPFPQEYPVNHISDDHSDLVHVIVGRDIENNLYLLLTNRIAMSTGVLFCCLSFAQDHHVGQRLRSEDPVALQVRYKHRDIEFAQLLRN